MTTQPPPLKPDPVADAARALGATVNKLPDDAPDANKRLDKMWRDHIKPALEKLADADADVLARVSLALSSIDVIQAALSAALYDPDAIVAIEAEIKEHAAILKAAPAKTFRLVQDLTVLDGRRLDLLAQADDIARPIRANIRNETYVNEDGKTKNTFPNDPARADALADALATNADYKAVAASLDKRNMDIALKNAEMEQIEGERKAASSLLWAARSRLENMTARMLTSAPHEA